jgi:hypothetical protein
MIKFFRQIRQNLLFENPPAKANERADKTDLPGEDSAKAGKPAMSGRYLKYAIGEIVLVMLGILLALQVNNWNENRKLQQEELRLLLEVKSNFEVTLLNFKNDSTFNQETIHQYAKIKHYIEEDLTYDRELDTAFGLLKSWRSPYPIYTAYMTLKTKGLDVISNSSLRNKIVNMNEYEFTRLITDYDKAEWILYQEVVLPFYLKHLRIYRENSNTLAKPTDFEFLKDSDELSNLLELLLNERESGLIMYNKIMLDIKDLIKFIDDELINRV